jgi:DNA-binding response OmpR family regulator
MRILAVEDDVACRQVLAEMFKLKPDWQVTIVDSGSLAWWHLTDPEASKPDLIVTDLRMPNVSGMDLLKRIRHDRNLNNLKVLVCSANKDRELVVQMINLGTSGYILKPFKPREMLTKIESILQHTPHRSIEMELGGDGGFPQAV